MEKACYSETLNNLSKTFSEKSKKQPNYFKELDKGQAPKILWIGCADSRVDPSEILNMRPGNIFVQRNVANQIHLHDPNALAVIEYAVIHLKVDYVVVCGHSNCGGVNASCGDLTKVESNLQAFLKPLGELCNTVSEGGKVSGKELQEKMYLENVKQQVKNVNSLEFVKDAVKNRGLQVLPMIFRLDSGLLLKVE